MRVSRLTAFAASGLSAAGLLAGHWLAYAVAHPGEPAPRAAQAPAHGWLAGAQEIVPLLAVIGAVALVLHRAVRRDAHDHLERAVLVRRLAAVQICAFASLEVAERLAAGGWSDLPIVVVVGVIAQLVTAWFVAIGLVGLSSLGARLGEDLARSAPTTVPALGGAPAASPLTVLARMDHRSSAIRGPPSPS